MKFSFEGASVGGVGRLGLGLIKLKNSQLGELCMCRMMLSSELLFPQGYFALIFDS